MSICLTPNLSYLLRGPSGQMSTPSVFNLGLPGLRFRVSKLRTTGDKSTSVPLPESHRSDRHTRRVPYPLSSSSVSPLQSHFRLPTRPGDGRELEDLFGHSDWTPGRDPVQGVGRRWAPRVVLCTNTDSHPNNLKGRSRGTENSFSRPLPVRIGSLYSVITVQ